MRIYTRLAGTRLADRSLEAAVDQSVPQVQREDRCSRFENRLPLLCHAEWHDLELKKGGPKNSIALDQTGYGAIQRIHLGTLNRTFPALYFPGSPLSVKKHCFGTLGQSASFGRRYLSKEKSAKPHPATGMAGGDTQGALGTAGAMG